MKRVLICLLLLMLPCAAFANGWGAPGTTVELFEGNREYSDYSCIADDYRNDAQTARLLMHSRYHNQLLCAEQVDGHWRVTDATTAAVYQPGSEKADKVRVDRIPEGFALFYPEEEYRFAKWGDAWELYWAQVDGLIFSREAAGEMLVIDGETTIIWQMGAYGEENAAMTLERFNIDLFPRSVDEVRRLNALRAVIADGGEMLWEPATESEERTLPVYSAPSAESWRAADGKAAVSLLDPAGLRTYGLVEGWQLVEYKVSLRTGRVGYIQSEAEPLNGAFFPTAVRTTGETYLTDDPGVSQYHQTVIPAGTKLTALDCYGPFYAYVETELEGQRTRGFVPLRDLELMPAEGAADIADALVGAWRGPGMQFAQNYIALGENGLFATYEEIDGRLMDRDRGTWAVRACAPERFNNDSTFALLLTYDNGRALYAGIALHGDTLSVATEASFDWSRAQPETWETEWDFMARVAGSYEIFAGGSMLAGDSFTLNADGTMVTHDDPAYTGTWAVTRYNPAEGIIWNDPEYTVFIALDNGYTCRRGMVYGVVEGSEYAGNQSLTLTDGEGSGGYIRTDIDVEKMQEMAGNYDFVSGDALLTAGRLRLHPQGYFYSEQDGSDAISGIWRLTRKDDAEEITFLVHDWSPTRAGEVLSYGCAFTPASGDEPAVIMFTDGERSVTYVWDEPAGNG